MTAPMFKIIGGDQKEYGPISADQLRQWIAANRVNAQTKVQEAGSTDWRPLAEFCEFADALKGRAVPAAAAPPTPPLPSVSASGEAQRSRLAVASLVLGILGVFTLGVTALVGLILGIVAHVRISGSRGRLSGSRTATAGIAVSAVTLALVPVIAILAGMLLPALARAKSKSQGIMCMNNMKQLALGLHMYANDNNDQLPQGANWCDAIQPYLGGGQALKCFSGDPNQRAHYAFNANLAGTKLSKIAAPAQTVLVFEIEGGWNVSGGPETLLKKPRHIPAVGVAFADGHTEIVMPQRLPNLRWEP